MISLLHTIERTNKDSSFIQTITKYSNKKEQGVNNPAVTKWTLKIFMLRGPFFVS